VPLARGRDSAQHRKGDLMAVFVWRNEFGDKSSTRTRSLCIQKPDGRPPIKPRRSVLFTARDGDGRLTYPTNDTKEIELVRRTKGFLRGRIFQELAAPNVYEALPEVPLGVDNLIAVWESLPARPLSGAPDLDLDGFHDPEQP